MKLKYSESHPLKSHEIQVQYLLKKAFVKKFMAFKWEELLDLMLKANPDEIHCSPSVNLEDETGKYISVSIVGELDDYEFYVCFKRPITQQKTKWFGLVKYEYYNKDFCSVIPQQTKQDALDAFLLFYERNFEELNERW